MTPNTTDIAQVPPTPEAALPAPRAIVGLLFAAYVLLPLSSAVSALLILIASGWLFGWRKRRSLPALGVASRLWGLLLGAVAFSALFSVNQPESWVGLVLTGAYLLVIWVTVAALDTPERYWQGMRLFFWGSVAWAAFGIVVSLMQFQWDFKSSGIIITVGTWDHRANSIFMHPNILAGYLLLSLGIGIALRTREGFARRWRYNGGILVILLCMLLTQSRSGWIGTASLVVLAGLLIDRRLLVKSLVAAAVALPFFHQVIWQRVLTLTASNFDSNLNRLRVWQSAREMIAERPLFGFGPGSWPQIYPRFRDPLEWENLPHSHSFFLHLGAEYGLVMLAALLLLIGAYCFRSVRDAWQTPYRGAALALVFGLLGYLMMGAFEFTFSEGRNSILFFTMLGLLAATRRFARSPIPPS
ncbi:O-Antigen ligase [compost metagenome]